MRLATRSCSPRRAGFSLSQSSDLFSLSVRHARSLLRPTRHVAMADKQPSRSAKSEVQGTEGLAINNSFLRRILTIAALKTLGRFHKSDGLCTPISKHKIVKTGHRVRLTEANTMQFVAEHTSIPVPKVHCSFVHNDRVFIVMERICGEDIPLAWKGRPESSRRKVYAELKAMLRELRALKPSPDTGVESCVGGSLYDSRIPRCPRFGPFKLFRISISGFGMSCVHQRFTTTARMTNGWKLKRWPRCRTGRGHLRSSLMETLTHSTSSSEGKKSLE